MGKRTHVCPDCNTFITASTDEDFEAAQFSHTQACQGWTHVGDDDE